MTEYLQLRNNFKENIVNFWYLEERKCVLF